MTIRRRFASVPPVMFMSTKRSRSYEAMPVRTSHYLQAMGYPTTRADRFARDTRAEAYMDDRVTSASAISSYAMEDGYDTARKSRDRDARLLRDATDAISGRRPATYSTAALLGPRRFPRRFGKPNARKNKSSSFYGTRLATEVKQKPVVSPVSYADVAPSGDWRNYARARSASVARSRFEDDLSLHRPGFQTRAQSVGPSQFRPRAIDALSRRSLPPSSVAAARESIISTRGQLGMPVRPAYIPVYEGYETDTTLPRRRHKVLATRLPFGNYYDRMLRKHGKLQGRPVMEYIPETSVVGSDLSGALSRVGRANDYRGASLLLSLEGSGVSNEGRRVGFTYTPPPIPLYGSYLGVGESILGTRLNLQPLDSFLTGHVARMGALKSQLNDYLSRDKSRRLQLGLSPLETGPRPMPTYNRSSFLSLDDMPVRRQSLPEIQHLPTTVMRRPAESLDVIPLGNIRPRIAAKEIKLPQTLTAGLKLSMLDKINIKVYSESFATPQASVAARRVARGVSMAPRATSLPPRPLYPEQVGFWDAPRSYGPLYGVDTTGTTTTADYYPYPYLSYPRRPLVLYPKPWLNQSADRIMMQKAQARARSVPPALFYREEQLLKRQSVPVYDAWRSTVRAKSVPPEMLPVTRPFYYPYYPYSSHYERRLSPYYRSKLALAQPSQPVALWSLPTEDLRAHRVPRRYLTRGEISSGFTSLWGYYDDPFARRRQREEEEDVEALKFGVRPRVLASPLARATLARAWRHTAHPFSLPKMAYVNESKYGFPMLFVPRKAAKQGERRKAAIIASKMDVDSFKGRRPRSEYAARKYRSMRRSDQEGVYLKSPYTSGYYASTPPLPKLTERKAIRTEEGYSKPKNLLSWQYRLDSIMKPKDLLSQPSSFGNIRRQVRAAQEGMDRHRQMLDRYLPEEGADSSDAAARVLRRMAEMDREPMAGGGVPERQRATVKIPNYYACGVDPANPPLSDLRRRIRRTLNKSRRN